MSKVLVGVLVGFVLAIGAWWYFSSGGKRDPVVELQRTVESQGKKAAAAVEKTVDHGLQEVKSGLDDAGAKIGREAADAALLASIKARLVTESGLSGAGINVDVDGGMVTLRGHVPSEAARAVAVKLARDTDGVKSVRSELVLKQPTTP